MEAILELGREFAAARDVLANHGNGVFGKWVQEECGVTRMTAYKYMRVYESIPEEYCKSSLQYFSPGALYKLTAPTIPEDILNDAIEEIKQAPPDTPLFIDEKEAKRRIDDVMGDEDEEPFDPADEGVKLSKKVESLIDKWPREHREYAATLVKQVGTLALGALRNEEQ